MRGLLASSFVLLTLLPSPASPQDRPEEPEISGYVTQVNSPSSFQANGIAVNLSSKTEILYSEGKQLFHGEGLHPYFGQKIEVYGRLDTKHQTIKATSIVLERAAPIELSGFAVIDRVPDSPPFPPGGMRVRADGYLLLLSPKTSFKSDLPDPSIQGLHTNVLIAYHGELQPDGTVTVDRAVAQNNVIVAKENKLLAKTDYDPDQVDPDARQGHLSKAFRGIDPKQIPPYPDPALQARIDRIGKSLVPAYQQALPDSDLTKVIFRFQLVDEPKWRDALTMPSGVILVPKHIAEQLTDDSQLATVLADNIATALEKQSFRDIPADQKLFAANLLGIGAGLVVPALGIATGLTVGGISASMQRHNLEQSGRVSLCLLSDAGYDIHQAPLVWWLLNSKSPLKPNGLAPPLRSANLYQTIGLAWRNSPPLTLQSRQSQ
jgi:hypothetical protein